MSVQSTLVSHVYGQIALIWADHAVSLIIANYTSPYLIILAYINVTRPSCDPVLVQTVWTENIIYWCPMWCWSIGTCRNISAASSHLYLMQFNLERKTWLYPTMSNHSVCSLIGNLRSTSLSPDTLMFLCLLYGKLERYMRLVTL